MASRRESLLKELIKLYVKYGDAEISATLKSIREGDAFNALSDLVTEVTSVAKKQSPTGGAASQRSTSRMLPRDLLNRSIDELSHSETQGKREIAALLISARDGEILKTSSAILAFMREIKIPVPGKGDRLTLLHRIGAHLSNLSAEELEPIIRIAKDTGQASSLQGWANIIVRKNGT